MLLWSQVQSTEAPMRDDSRGYEYNIDVSRTLAQRGGGSIAQVGTSMSQYPQDMHLLSSGGMPASYRGNSYGSMGPKNYYSMGSEWADAYGSDGGVDYSLSCPPYQVINNDIVPGYGHWGGARHKTVSQVSSVYLDSDPGYAYGTGSTANLVHRPAVSVSGADSSAYSFSSIAASLPSTGNERLLPNPVSRTLSSSLASYRGDGLSAGYSSSKSNHNSVIPSGAAGQTSPVSPISDVTAEAAAYASSAYDYATTMRAPQHHSSSSSDAYASVSTGSSETIFGDADRGAATQGPAVDLTGYTYGGGSPTDTSSMRRASSGSGLTSRSAGDSSASSTSYIGSDGGASAVHGSGPYHHSSSSSHGHHHHTQSQQQQASSHHASPRHGSHHHLAQQHVVTGVTSFGEASGSHHASSGVSGTTAVVDSHRTSLPSRR